MNLIFKKLFLGVLLSTVLLVPFLEGEYVKSEIIRIVLAWLGVWLAWVLFLMSVTRIFSVKRADLINIATIFISFFILVLLVVHSKVLPGHFLRTFFPVITAVLYCGAFSYARAYIKAKKEANISY